MENASKALIIAGAILLSILIISLGIMVYQNAKETVGNTSLSKQEKEAFNSEWETYVGTKRSATEVRTMISAIIASNAAESQSGANRFVSIQTTEFTGSVTAPTALPSISMPTLTENATYKVSVGYDGSTGLVGAVAYVQN